MRAIAEDFRPDLTVRDRGEFAEWVVGEAIGVPVVTVTFGLVPRRERSTSAVALGGSALQG